MPYANKARQRRYARYWVKLQRKTWFAAHGPCTQCGSWKNLELHHIDPTQKIEHRIWSWSAERRAVELAKCEVLCRNCHRQKTSEQFRSTKPCGTRARYLLGCRCHECRRANADYAAKQKARKAAA